MPIRLALIGAGIFAREAHRPAIVNLLQADRVVVHAIWSRTASSSAALAELYAADCASETGPKAVSGDAELQSLVDSPDVDAVVIALPIPQLASTALRFLKAGKHVLAEKPLAANANQASDTLEEYAKLDPMNKPLYFVAENFRTEAGLRRVAELVQGSLGKLVSVHMTAHNVMKAGSKYAQGWRMQEGKLGYIAGQLLDGGVHYIAGMRIAANADICRVTAKACKCSDHLPEMDTVHALVEFENGLSGTVALSFAASTFRWELIVLGTEGRVTLRRGRSGAAVGYFVVFEKDGTEPNEEFLPFSGVDEEFQAFVSACESGKPFPALSALAAYNDVACIQAFVDSSACGQPVDVLKPPAGPGQG